MEADAVLPFGLGGLHMIGVLNKDMFYFECTKELTLGELELHSVHYLAKYEVANPQDFILSMVLCV